MQPLDSVERAQCLHERSQRGSLAALEILHRVERNPGAIGELLLVEVLPQAEDPDLPAEIDLPAVRCRHELLIDLNRSIVNVCDIYRPNKGY